MYLIQDVGGSHFSIAKHVYFSLAHKWGVTSLSAVESKSAFSTRRGAMMLKDEYDVNELVQEADIYSHIEFYNTLQSPHITFHLGNNAQKHNHNEPASSDLIRNLTRR